MRQLPRREDPTGFLNLFRMAASDAFGDPKGKIHGRGKWPHLRKAGPGCRRTGPWNHCQHGAKHIHSSPTPRGY